MWTRLTHSCAALKQARQALIVTSAGMLQFQVMKSDWWSTWAYPSLLQRVVELLHDEVGGVLLCDTVALVKDEEVHVRNLRNKSWGISVRTQSSTGTQKPVSARQVLDRAQQDRCMQQKYRVSVLGVLQGLEYAAGRHVNVG